MYGGLLSLDISLAVTHTAIIVQWASATPALLLLAARFGCLALVHRAALLALLRTKAIVRRALAELGAVNESAADPLVLWIAVGCAVGAARAGAGAEALEHHHPGAALAASDHLLALAEAALLRGLGAGHRARGVPRQRGRAALRVRGPLAVRKMHRALVRRGRQVTPLGAWVIASQNNNFGFLLRAAID